MPAGNLNEHREVLLKLLKRIYTHPVAGSWLGFKGGTALYFLENLPRFSVDLDFDVLPETRFDYKVVEEVVKKHLEILDTNISPNSWMLVGRYNKSSWHVKVDISRRGLPAHYKMRRFLGVSLQVMTLPDMCANKLAAISDRKNIANRDLFDAHWFLDHMIEPNSEIIKIRTKQTVTEYYKFLIDYIPKNISRRGILDGIGELISEKQKWWVKNKLEEELLFLLRSKVELDK